MKWMAFIILSALAINSFAETIYLKPGRSSVIQFNEAPVGIILGNPKAFQAERYGSNLVLRSNVASASTNLFVLFKKSDLKSFDLHCDPELKQTSVLKVDYPELVQTSNTDTFKPIQQTMPKDDILKLPRNQLFLRVMSASWTKHKDYLNITVRITNTHDHRKTLGWKYASLKKGDKFIVPAAVRARRAEVAPNEQIYTKLEYKRPDVPADLKDIKLVLPVKDSDRIEISMEGIIK